MLTHFVIFLITDERNEIGENVEMHIVTSNEEEIIAEIDHYASSYPKCLALNKNQNENSDYLNEILLDEQNITDNREPENLDFILDNSDEDKDYEPTSDSSSKSEGDDEPKRKRKKQKD